MRNPWFSMMISTRFLWCFFLRLIANLREPTCGTELPGAEQVGTYLVGTVGWNCKNCTIQIHQTWLAGHPQIKSVYIYCISYIICILHFIYIYKIVHTLSSVYISILYHVTLYYVMLYYITLYYIILYYIVLYCIMYIYILYHIINIWYII